jgi:hypothetical protein
MSDQPETSLEELSKDELIDLIQEHERVFLVNKVVKVGFVLAIGMMIMLAL